MNRKPVISFFQKIFFQKTSFTPIRKPQVFSKAFRCFVFYSITSVALLGAGASSLSAYTFNPTNAMQKKVDEKILEGLGLLHEGNYVETLDAFRQVIAWLPEHPAGYFYYAAALQWLISDYRNFEYRDVFLENLEIAMEKADKMLDENKEDPWGYLYYGAALGFRGVYHSDNGNFFKGFRDGTRSYRFLQKAIEYEPNLYDVYYGIGLYDFYKAYYLEKFLWLGEGTRTKEDGIAGIKVSIEKGKYSNIEAAMTLIRVYYEDERYNEAIAIAEELVERFPNYLFGMWFLARAYVAVGEHEKSYNTYLAIKAIIENSVFKSNTSFFEIDYQIAKYHQRKGETEKALEVVNNALAVSDELDKRLKYVKKYLKAAEKLQKQLQKELEKG